MSEENSKSDEVSSFKLSESPAHLLRRSQQFATEIYSDLGLADNVTLRQSVVLAAVAEKEGLSQSDLVNTTGIDRSTLADMIARMEMKGLVSRSAAETDARAKSVFLTDAGRIALDEAMPAMQTVDKALLHALPKNKRKSFLATLALLHSAAEGVEPPKANGKNKDKSKGDKKKSKKKTSSKKKKSKK
ncbi:MarR family winged helix-turn-helix transcriptional regulator [Hirschia litorea]|uniref:MarR family winged helix-turn-helix transcriptional regulator n=1 Tax=Hirschia litorea TaxID=1199156 RepID=A0ABW2IN06_9PROT